MLSLNCLCYEVNGTAIDFGSNLEVFSPENAEEASALRMTASESGKSERDRKGRSVEAQEHALLFLLQEGAGCERGSNLLCVKRGSLFMEREEFF